MPVYYGIKFPDIPRIAAQPVAAGAASGGVRMPDRVMSVQPVAAGAASGGVRMPDRVVSAQPVPTNVPPAPYLPTPTRSSAPAIYLPMPTLRRGEEARLARMEAAAAAMNTAPQLRQMPDTALGERARLQEAGIFPPSLALPMEPQYEPLTQERVRELEEIGRRAITPGISPPAPPRPISTPPANTAPQLRQMPDTALVQHGRTLERVGLRVPPEFEPLAERDIRELEEMGRREVRQQIGSVYLPLRLRGEVAPSAFAPPRREEEQQPFFGRALGAAGRALGGVLDALDWYNRTVVEPLPAAFWAQRPPEVVAIQQQLAQAKTEEERRRLNAELLRLRRQQGPMRARLGTPEEVQAYREQAPFVMQMLAGYVFDPLNILEAPVARVIDTLREARRAAALRPVAMSVEQVADAMRREGVFGSGIGRFMPWRLTNDAQASGLIAQSTDILNTLTHEVPGDTFTLLNRFINDPDTLADLTGGLTSSLPAKQTAALLRQVLRDPETGEVSYQTLSKIIRASRGDVLTATADLARKFEEASYAFFPKQPRSAPLRLRDATYSVMALGHMGYNFGYAVRNAANNLFTSVFDGYIPFTPPGHMREFLSRFGPLPVRAKAGMGPAAGLTGHRTDVVRFLQSMTEPVKSSELWKGVTWKGPTQTLAANIERMFSEQVTFKALERAWGDIWARETDDLLRRLRQAGVPADVAEYVAGRTRLALNAHEVRSAVADIRKRLPQISIPQEVITRLADVVGEARAENIVKMVGGVHTEDAARAAMDIIDTLVNMADDTARATGSLEVFSKQKLSTAMDFDAWNAQITEFLKREDDILQKAFDAHHQAVREIWQKTTGMLPEEREPLWRAFYSSFLHSIDESNEAIRAAEEALLPQLGFNEADLKLFARQRAEMLNTWREYSVRLAKTWRQSRQMKQGAARDQLWRDWFSWSDEHWRAWRASRLQYEQRIRAAFRAAASRIGVGVAQIPTLDDIRRVASQAGIATATKQGKPTDRHLLAVIRKRAGIEVKRIADLTDEQRITVINMLRTRAQQAAAGVAKEVEEAIGAVPSPLTDVPAVPPAQAGAALTKAAQEVAGVLARTVPEVAQAVEEMVVPVATETAETIGETAARAARAVPTELLHPMSRASIWSAIGSPLRSALRNMRVTAKQVSLDTVDDAMARIIVDEVERTAQRMVAAKELAKRAGIAARDFAMGDYSRRRNLHDWVMWLFPYFTWYGFTYPNWAVRLARNPAFLSSYARYKRLLRDENDRYMREQYGMREMPIQYRDMVRIPGSGGPLWVHIEKLLFPLYNLVDADFTTRELRETPQWIQIARSLGNYGPSLAPPILWAAALSIAATNPVAARQLVGYQLSFSRPLKTFTAALREWFPALQGVIPPGGLVPEGYINPTVAGGDIWSERRIPIWLDAMVASGEITQEEAELAAYRRSGPVWDRAKQMEAMSRLYPEMVSFAFGASLRPVTDQDVRMARMWEEWNALRQEVAGLPRDQQRLKYDEFHRRWNTRALIAMAREYDPVERLSSFTWMVLDRLPPGYQRQRALEEAGIAELVNKFYASHGRLTLSTTAPVPGAEFQYPLPQVTWTPEEITALAEGIEKLADRFSIPSPTLAAEFERARELHSEVRTKALEAIQGIRGLNYSEDDIRAIEGGYFALTDDAQRKAYLDQHPELRAFWSAQDMVRTGMAPEELQAERRFYETPEAAINRQVWEEMLPPGGAWRRELEARGIVVPSYVTDLYDEQKRLAASPEDIERARRWLQDNVSSEYMQTEEWRQAREANARLKELQVEALGEDFMSWYENAYLAMTPEQRRAYRKSHPDVARKIYALYDFNDDFGAANPIWQKYYGYDAATVGETARAIGSRRSARGVRRRSYRRYRRYGARYGARGAPTLPVATPSTGEAGGFVPTQMTREQYAAILAERQADTSFSPLARLLFGSDIFDLVERWFSMTEEERTAFMQQYQDLFARIMRFLAWLIGGGGSNAARALASIPGGAPVPMPTVLPMPGV